ncbi:MAG: ATP-binding protein, partial [Deltaproteobacteria bacterium]|nr:ATP-binding protein [Deltaproteobacteria bacterium]
MKRVDTAIEKGRCVIAIAGSLLKSAEIMLALSDRSAVPSIALSGPAVTPVRPPTQDAVAAALQPGGVLVLVDPQLADMPAVKMLAEHASRGAHKPEVVVVAKSYSPFLLGGSFSGMRVTHEKGRGPSFIKNLPIPDAAAALPAFAKSNEKQKKKPKKGSEAPRFVFVGRDDELGQLGELLSTGGPLVVSGPEGVGRSLLVEHAIAKSGLQRLPDLTLGYGVGADTLAGRIAAVARVAGCDTLYQLLAKEEHTPREVARVAVEALQAASATEGQAMVVRCLDYALGREADFFRKSRLEMLLEALLTSTYPLRLVFVSSTQPVFFRET